MAAAIFDPDRGSGGMQGPASASRDTTTAALLMLFVLFGLPTSATGSAIVRLGVGVAILMSLHMCYLRFLCHCRH